MRRRMPAAALGLLLWLGPGAATAQQFPVGKQEITTEGKTEAHPKRGVIELEPLSSNIGRGLKACAHYGTTKADQKGKVLVRVELLRGGEVEEEVKFRGLIGDAEEEDGQYGREFLACTKAQCPADPAEPCEDAPRRELRTVPREGDVFVFYFTYRRFRPLGPEDLAEVAVGVYPAS